MYFSSSVLVQMLVHLLRVVAPSCASVSLRCLPGPYRYRNWSIEAIGVAEGEMEAADAFARVVEAARYWIVVPDGHPLDGQIVGRERVLLH